METELNELIIYYLCDISYFHLLIETVLFFFLNIKMLLTNFQLWSTIKKKLEKTLCKFFSYKLAGNFVSSLYELDVWSVANMPEKIWADYLFWFSSFCGLCKLDFVNSSQFVNGWRGNLECLFSSEPAIGFYVMHLFKDLFCGTRFKHETKQNQQ